MFYAIDNLSRDVPAQQKKQQEIAQSVPDPSPREGMGSGNETNCQHATKFFNVVKTGYGLAIVLLYLESLCVSALLPSRADNLYVALDPPCMCTIS